jgi:hypothetical protein
MSRFFHFLFSLAIIVGFNPATAFAHNQGAHAQATPDFYPRDQTSLFGEDHAYTVVFRADGGAVAYGRIAVGNSADTKLETLSYTVPDVSVTSFEAFQEFSADKICPIVSPDQPCPYYNYGFGYQKAKVTQEGTKFTITLPTAIEKGQDGTVVIAYRADGYAKKGPLGLFTFEFKTPTTPSAIRTTNVTIDVDSDLYIRTKTGRVAYQKDTSQFASVVSSEESLASFSSQIGGTGQITKTGQGLQPGESLVVKGSYATNRVVLLWKEIAIGILILAALWFSLRWWKKRSGTKTQHFGGTMTPENTLLALAGAGGIVIFNYLSTRILQSGLFGNVENVQIPLLLVLLAAFIYLILFIGPATYTGAKNGWKHGAYVAIVQAILLLAYLIVSSMLYQSPGYPGPYPL